MVLGAHSLVKIRCLVTVFVALGALTPTGASTGRAAAPSLGTGWQRIELTTTEHGAQTSISTIVPGGPGLVGLGTEGTTSQLYDIWTSVDGKAWDRRTLLDVISVGDYVGDIAVRGPRIVIVGAGPDLGPDQQLQPRFWFSPDSGVRWHTTTPLGAGTGVNVPERVVAFGSDFIAAGRERSGAEGERATLHTVIWRSADGIHWHQSQRQAGVFDNALPSALVTHAGTLVLAGTAMSVGGGAVIWTSKDGDTWDRLSLDPAVFPAGSSIQQMLSNQDGFLAFGSVPSLENGSAVWTSKDGTTWERRTDAPLVVQPVSLVSAVRSNSIMAGSQGIVAIGTQPNVAQGSSILWSSTDGMTWSGPLDERMWGSGIVTANTIASFKGRLVVAGTSAPPPKSCTRILGGQFQFPTAATVWIWTPSRSGVAPRPVDRTDPRIFRLQGADVPPGYRAVREGYVDGCAGITGAGSIPTKLGVFSTYAFAYDAAEASDTALRQTVRGASIVAQSVAAAKKLMSHAAHLVATGSAGTSSTVTRLTSDLQLGDETRAYRVPTVNDPSAPPMDAIVWRQGKYVGEITAVTQDRSLARELAQRQLRHLEDALR